ncbi:minor tail protein [Arthrobacter phage Orcanus]|nr:minor tail protein [Arthrobacter phage Orcanus]
MIELLEERRRQLVTNPALRGTSGTADVRTNLVTNPVPASTTGFNSSGGAGALTYNSSEAEPFVRFTKDATTATTALYFHTAQTVPAGAVVSMRFWIRLSYATTVTIRNDATAIAGSAVAVPANTWTELVFDGYAVAGTTFRLALVISSLAGNSTVDLKKGLAEVAGTVGAFFSGATPAGGDFTYSWVGSANNSQSVQRGTAVTLAAYNAGTGGAGVAYRSLDAPAGASYSLKALQTVASTGGSPGLTFTTQVAGSAGDVLSASCWVKFDTARNVKLLCRPRNVSTVVGPDTSVVVAVPANTWTLLKVEGLVATGAYTNIQIWPLLVSPGHTVQPWQTQQMALPIIEKASTVGGYFDGSTPSADGPGLVYSWAGTVDASVSIETERLSNIVAEPLAEGPWAGVTVRGLAAGEAVLNIWRTADGERLAIRGGKNLEAVDSAFVIDYEVPLGRAVTYELEVVSGPDAGASAVAPVMVRESDCGYIHDPLDPLVAVPVYRTAAPGGEAVLGVRAWQTLTRAADVEVHQVVGSSKPVAIGGQRQAPADFPLDLLTDAETHNTILRDLMDRAAVIVVRGLPEWLGSAWPAVAYVALPEVVETPLTAGRGGPGRFLTQWTLEGQNVRSSAARVLVALFTYQEVEEMFTTYAQKQAAAGGGTYLDDLKNPLG